MANADKFHFHGEIVTVFLLLIITIIVQAQHIRSHNRCLYVTKPHETQTVWKYEGEEVTLACPGYEPASSATYNVGYTWFKQEFNCIGMSSSTIVARYIYYVEGESNQGHTRIRMKKHYGQLTIKNVLKTDEHVFTCIFFIEEEHIRKEYIATVDLKIKGQSAARMDWTTVILGSLLGVIILVASAWILKKHMCTIYKWMKIGQSAQSPMKQPQIGNPIILDRDSNPYCEIDYEVLRSGSSLSAIDLLQKPHAYVAMSVNDLSEEPHVSSDLSARDDTTNGSSERKHTFNDLLANDASGGIRRSTSLRAGVGRSTSVRGDIRRSSSI